MSHDEGHEIEQLQVLVGALDQVVVHLGDLLEDDRLFEVAQVTAFHKHIVELGDHLIATVAVVDQVLSKIGNNNNLSSLFLEKKMLCLLEHRARFSQTSQLRMCLPHFQSHCRLES